jgi:class 3 adenylate cyclase
VEAPLLVWRCWSQALGESTLLAGKAAANRELLHDAEIFVSDDCQTVSATFCFVDVAGFTALTEAHGDHAAAHLVERFEILVNNALPKAARLVDTIGDAALVSTPTPHAALDFLSELFSTVSAETDFPALRAGLNHGEVVKRGERFYGATLNLAARVASLARGGQIVATAPVAEVAAQRGVRVTAIGEFHLKNVHVPVELFALHLPGTEVEAVTDPVCRMLVDPERAAGHLRHKGRDYWFCSLDCAARFAAAPDSYAEVK